MNKENVDQVKATIDSMIQAGLSFNAHQLDEIYHDDLQVVMVDDLGQKMIADKAIFKNLFATKKQNGDLPLNSSAVYHHIEATDKNAHVIVNRKLNLTGEERNLLLSLDLRKENDRWQVVREVIFSRPLA